MMSSLATNKDAIDALVKIVATLFAVLGGGWGLYQYFKGTQLRAAEILLKMEEEFRNHLRLYVQLEDLPTYERVIKPVLQAERDGRLDDAGLKTIVSLDRCLRFLYLCSLLNEKLRVDQALFVPGGALQEAYYHYISLLLERAERPELVAYTDREYRHLTAWVQAHESELRSA